MKNITFVTHFRNDVKERLDNLKIILKYYVGYFDDSNFFIVEDDKYHYDKLDEVQGISDRIKLFFMKNDGVYHRTKAINHLIKNAETNIIAHVDADCIVNREEIIACYEKLQDGYSIAWPYNGRVIDFKRKEFNIIFKKKKMDYNFLLESLSSRSDELHIRCVCNCYGGFVMLNKNNLREYGGYNEKFLAWGGEDEEITDRIVRLGGKKYRSLSRYNNLFHLYHSKAIRKNHKFYSKNKNTMFKTRKYLKKEELVKLVKEHCCVC